MADEKILSYNDVVLRKSDLSILNGPYFLNDRIIEFFFSYLTSLYPSQDILLVPPGISFWITNCPDVESLKEVIEPLKLPEKKVVIFAVNNNRDVTLAEGGTHWTLLAYERNTNVFVHHDSVAGANLREAKRLYNAVERFMDVSASSSSAKILFRDASIPQQKNGYDCGLFVTAIARFICEWHSIGGGSKHNKDPTEKEDELWLNVLNEKEVQSTVSMMRNEILRIILDMISKK